MEPGKMAQCHLLDLKHLFWIDLFCTNSVFSLGFPQALTLTALGDSRVALSRVSWWQVEGQAWQKNFKHSIKGRRVTYQHTDLGNITQDQRFLHKWKELSWWKAQDAQWSFILYQCRKKQKQNRGKHDWCNLLRVSLQVERKILYSVENQDKLFVMFLSLSAPCHKCLPNFPCPRTLSFLLAACWHKGE